MAMENTKMERGRVLSCLARCQRIFMIGIGGVSMSSLALLAVSDGFCYRVCGSDAACSPAMRAKLEGAGIAVYEGHCADRLADGDAVVYTVAIGEDNPEYAEARRRGLPLFSRADFMGALLSRFPIRVGIAGTHGKSTTTAMAAAVALAGGLDPTVLCGADMPVSGGAFLRGGDKICLFEACEYKDSFLRMSPTLAVVLNIERDHPDYFHTQAQVDASFRSYIARAGAVWANGMDDGARRALSMSDRVDWFGGAGDEVRAENISIARGNGLFGYDLIVGNSPAGRVDLQVPGAHNLVDSLGAAAVGYALGVSPEQIACALSGFTGVARRLERRGAWHGAAIYDDYAHHPTEICASLSALRRLTEGRLAVVFQPHTYSRTAEWAFDFAAALSLADMVVLRPVYAAREGLPSAGDGLCALCAAIGEKAQFVQEDEETMARLARRVRPGDVVAVMGAGDGNRLIEKMEKEENGA